VDVIPAQDSKRSALTAGLVLTVASIAFEALAVPTVMPEVARELGGLKAYGWVFSAFMLANVVGITAAGQRTDRDGPLGSFGVGLALFGLGLAIGGAAPSMAVLIAARVVQGLGGGALSAVVYACVARAYPNEQQPRMLAMISTAWVVPGLIGPALSGLVADHLGWRLVFFGLLPPLPVVAILTLPILRRLPRADQAAPIKSQLGAAVLLAAGVVAILMGLQSHQLLLILGYLIAGAAASVYGLQRLMPAGTLTVRPGLPAAILAMGLVSVAFFGAETVVPLLITSRRHQSLSVAGLALTAATLTWTAGAWVQARLAKSRSRRALVAAGAVLIAAGVAMMASVVRETTPIVTAWIAWGVAGLGMGIAYATITLTVLEQAPKGGEGAASAAMQLANVVGVALGAGIVGAIVARAASADGGFTLAFGLMTVAALLALATALRLPGPKPA
jgi:MFS family permease